MNAMPIQEPVRAILLDIEGTTTPIAFVHQTLFPFARVHLADYLARNAQDAGLRADLALLRREHAAEAGYDAPLPEDDLDAALAYLHWLMDRDRKSTPLKSIQGKIWEDGYRGGHLLSEVYPDVPPAMRRWRAQGRRVCIYSSGSVLAQRLLFGHTTAGDLTGELSGYFDTEVGPKRDARSYARIAEALALPAPEILFLSDVVEELQAAHQAGLQTALSVRPGNPPQPEQGFAARIENFNGIFPAADGA